MSRVAVLLVVLSSAAFAQTDDGGVMGIEAFEPAPSMSIETFEPVDAGPQPMLEALSAATSWSPTARVYGFVSAFTALDTRFDSPRGAPLAENVWEGRVRALAGADVKLSERLRVVLEGRAFLRGTSQRDFDRAKGFFEPMLGDAYVDVYLPAVDLRVGTQRIPLGANAAFAPADSLNPKDLRETMGDVETSVLPVFAIRAQGDVGPISWLAAYVPFFEPHRFFVFGQDEGFLQPGLGVTLDNTRVDPSVEDLLQPRVLETQRPPPLVGDLALRVRTTTRFKLGASWVWMNEKQPRVTVDGEVASLLAAQAAGRSVDQAAAVSVLNWLQAGQTLYRGFYGRQHLFSLEGSTLLGPGQLDLDVTFTPRQTFYDANLSPVDKAATSWLATFSQASDSIFTYAISYFGLWVPGVGANEELLLLEPATAAGTERSVFLHLVSAVLGLELFDRRLTLSLRAAFEVVQRSFTLAPRVGWKPVDAVEVYAAAELFEGRQWSPLGYFSRNDRVLVGARWDF